MQSILIEQFWLPYSYKKNINVPVAKKRVFKPRHDFHSNLTGCIQTNYQVNCEIHDLRKAGPSKEENHSPETLLNRMPALHMPFWYVDVSNLPLLQANWQEFLRVSNVMERNNSIYHPISKKCIIVLIFIFYLIFFFSFLKMFSSPDVYLINTMLNYFHLASWGNWLVLWRPSQKLTW